MNEKLEQYITTLERLQDTVEQQDQAAITYAIGKLKDELQKASMTMLST